LRQPIERTNIHLLQIMVVNVAAISFFNLSPVILGALVDERGFSYQQIGWLAGLFMLGLAGVNTVWGLVQPRVSRHKMSRIGSLLAIICFAGGAHVTDFLPFALLLTGAGIGCGLCFGLAITCLGEDAFPESKFGYMQALQTLTAALGLFMLPLSATTPLGISGNGMLLCTVLMLAAFFSSSSLRASSQPFDEIQHATPKSNWLFWVACIILLLNVAAEASVWSFIERIGVSNEIANPTVAQILAASFFAAGFGSIAGGVLGIRYGRLLPFLSAVSLSILAVIIFWWSSSLVGYVIAVMLFSAAWNFGACYRMGLAIAADETGHRAPLIPAAQTLGAAIGPAIGGSLIFDGRFSGLYSMAIILWIITVILFYSVNKRLNIRDNPSAL